MKRQSKEQKYELNLRYAKRQEHMPTKLHKEKRDRQNEREAKQEIFMWRGK